MRLGIVETTLLGAVFREGGEVSVHWRPTPHHRRWDRARDRLLEKGLLERFQARAAYGYPQTPSIRLTQAGRAALGGGA